MTPPFVDIRDELVLFYKLAKYWEIQADKYPAERKTLQSCAKGLRQRTKWVEDAFDLNDLIAEIWQRLCDDPARQKQFSDWFEHMRKDSSAPNFVEMLRSFTYLATLPDFSLSVLEPRNEFGSES